MHRIDGDDDQDVHDVVRVEIEVQASGKPFLRDVHSPNSSTEHGYAILNTKGGKT
jgi:hypothetical protein